MASPLRRVALITLTVFVAGLVAVVIRLAPATAVNNPNATIQVTREIAYGTTAAGATTVTLTATLYSNISSLGTPIAWEVEGGPADTDGATPNQPDFRCTANASNQCSFQLLSAGSGTGLVRAWVDPDAAQPPIGTNEADTAEGRLSDSTPFLSALATNRSDCRDDPSTQDTEEDTPNDECFRDANTGQPATPQPGQNAEPDGTDVVQYSFAGAASRLDCDDDTLLNGQDSEVNPTGRDQTLTCRATDSSGTPVPGTMIDGENVSNADGGTNGFGSNDPDNTAGGVTPDYDTTNSASPVGTDFCTTNSSGLCEATISAAEGQSGPAYICFWIDAPTESTPTGDANVTVNTPGAGNVGNGGECGPNEPVNEAEANDATDTILLQWDPGPAAAFAIDVSEPESIAPAAGSTAAFNVVVYDQFGDTFSGGTTIWAEYFTGSLNDRDGNGPASPDRSCATGQHYACSLTFTSNATGTDLICVWLGSAPSMAGEVSNGTCAGETITDDATVDSVDVVRSVWSTASAPANNPPQVNASGQGYVLVGSDGGLFTFGSAQFKGSLGSTPLNQPIIGIAYKPGGTGYWLVAKDGGVFTFGDAAFYGSTGNMKLNSPVLGMESTPDGGGYWLYAADGGIFTFGNAKFHGSTGNMKLNSPVVGMAVTSSGNGYWLVAQDGGIFTFNAPFHGSTGNMKLNQPVFDMAPAKGDKGYWLVARDGGVFTFGSGTPYYGSGVGNVTGTVIGMDSTPTGEGYWIADSNGKVVPFGDARSFGDRSGKANNTQMIAFATVKPKL
jgi:hypothetical protein